MNEVKIPYVFYYYVHSKLWEMVDSQIVDEKKLAGLLFEWRIPKQLRRIIIKELELLGLIEKINRFDRRVIKPEFSEDNLFLIKETLGMIPQQS